jgi:hypothetical protein
VSVPVAVVTRSPGCELGALPWLLAGRQSGAAPRPGCAVGLDRLDAWEASRRNWTRKGTKRSRTEVGGTEPLAWPTCARRGTFECSANGGLFRRSRWATFTLLIDITVVNVALPSIRQDLGASFTDLQWVVGA